MLTTQALGSKDVSMWSEKSPKQDQCGVTCLGRLLELAVASYCMAVWSQEHNRATSLPWKWEARGPGGSECL